MIKNFGFYCFYHSRLRSQENRRAESQENRRAGKLEMLIDTLCNRAEDGPN